MVSKVAIVGAGAWGTTLSILFAEKGHAVSLWVYEKDLAEEMQEQRENKKSLPGFPLPENINITGDIQATAEAEIIVFATPTQFLRSVAAKLAKKIGPQTIIAAANKGIEIKSLKLPLEILGEELKTEKLAAISGPNLSSEIAKGLPAATVAASRDAQIARTVQESLMLERFRVYTNADPTGVQLGGALKNIIAIAAGVADGLELGNNAKAGLMIRGLAEITRLGTAMGAEAKTFAGLSGMGDLITTCAGNLSRNHRLGCRIAQGKKLAEILAESQEVAEGVPTTKAALALGKKHRITLPITGEVYKILYEGKDPCQAITDLMTRTPTSE